MNILQFFCVYILLSSVLSIENEFFWEQKEEPKNEESKSDTKTLILKQDDYDKLTYPKLLRLANEQAPTGEDLYEKLQGQMQTINPQFKYDVFKGYDPLRKETGDPKLITLNKYDAMSGIYQPAKLEIPLIEEMLQNLDTINPYLLAKLSPMTTLQADKFPPNFQFDLSTGSKYVPNSIKKHIDEEYFSDNMVNQNAKNDFYYDNPKAKLLLEKHNPGYLAQLQWLTGWNSSTIDDPNAANNHKRNFEAFRFQETNDKEENESKDVEVEQSSEEVEDFDDQEGIHLVKNTQKRLFDREKLLAAIKSWSKTSYILKKKIKQTIKVPVYIPIPIFSYQQVPVVHHYPQKQLVKQIIPVKAKFPVFHTSSRIVPNYVPVQQRILVPQAVPYGIKVPVPVPVPDYDPNVFGPADPPELISPLKKSYDGKDNTQTITDDRGAVVYQRHNENMNQQTVKAPQTIISDQIIEATNQIPRFKSLDHELNKYKVKRFEQF